jgi:hypothetical protein
MSKRWAILVAPFALMIGCDGGGDPGDDPGDGADSGAAPEVTYYRDIKPILDAKCVGCHTTGEIAPFELRTYEQAVAHAGVAQIAVNDRIMPPWLAEDGCNEYVGDRSLSDEQIATFNRWVELGTPAGDPADEGEPLADEDPGMSRVDLTLSMAEAYTSRNQPDDYRCFLVDWPETERTTYVTGFNAVPGNPTVVHHVIAFLATPDQASTYRSLDAAEDGPGYTCFGGTRGPAQTWIGSWAPGRSGSDFPAGTGIAIPPGAMFILQVHYNTLAAEPQEDVTKLELKVDDEVDLVAVLQPWANPAWFGAGGMSIPANDPDVMHSWAYDATVINGGQPFIMYGIGFHMHNLGTRGKVHIQRAGGGTECLLEIERWDFGWQGDYGFREPVRFDPGDKLYMECHWDNTLENQPMVDGQPLPPRDVSWGEGTTDEMCLTGWYMTDLP